jgi:tRNA(fMet)-specific endonuclease VapC
MSLYVFDTDILSLFQKGHAAVIQHARIHSPDDLAITVLTVEEQLSGWYTRLRKAKDTTALARAYQELANSVKVLADLRILSFTEPAIRRYESLKAQKIKGRKMDLRIAAVVLENGGTLVTRNLRDFQQIPNLPLENWAV